MPFTPLAGGHRGLDGVYMHSAARPGGLAALRAPLGVAHDSLPSVAARTVDLVSDVALLGHSIRSSSSPRPIPLLH